MNKPPKELHKKAVFKAITDDGTFATVLHLVCLVSYGEEIYDVDFLELRARLSDDFHAELSESNENKLNAILLAVSTEAFYEDPNAFRAVCNSLIAGDPGLDVLDDLTVPEMMWGIYEVDLNHGPGELGTRVQALVTRIMDAESQDPEDEADYVTNALEETRTELARQLTEIGLDGTGLPPVGPQALPEPALTSDSIL